MKDYYCCEMMERNKSKKIEPDTIICFSDIFNEFGVVIHDGGESYILIHYCPWCGEKLPLSQRNSWFEELAKAGYENPFGEDIPKEYQSSLWRIKRNKK